MLVIPLILRIWVYNQGTQAAYDINIVDYSPTDMAIITSGAFSPNWIDGGTTAALYIAGPLAAGDSVSTTVTYEVNDNFMGTSITNTAEITSADNDSDNGNGRPTDIDSDADANNLETGVVNDEITQDGKNGEDEDDHDIEPITVSQTFDLALKKVLATGQSSTVNAGDTVDFSIIVFNQGNPRCDQYRNHRLCTDRYGL